MVLIFFSLGHHWNILDLATLVPDVIKLTQDPYHERCHCEV
jgi:hypothetical protein